MTGETGDPKRAISIEAPTVSAHFSASKLFRRRDGKRLDPFRRRPTSDREVSEEFPFIYCHPNLCGTIVWPLLKPTVSPAKNSLVYFISICYIDHPVWRSHHEEA